MVGEYASGTLRVKAVQIDALNAATVTTFCGLLPIRAGDGTAYYMVPTPNGEVQAGNGDYIAKDSNLRLWVYPEAGFESSFVRLALSSNLGGG